MNTATVPETTDSRPWCGPEPRNCGRAASGCPSSSIRSRPGFCSSTSRPTSFRDLNPAAAKMMGWPCMRSSAACAMLHMSRREGSMPHHRPRPDTGQFGAVAPLRQGGDPADPQDRGSGHARRPAASYREPGRYFGTQDAPRKASRRARNSTCWPSTAATTAIWDWDMRNNEKFFSPQWKRMIGYEDPSCRTTFETFENTCTRRQAARHGTPQRYLNGEGAQYGSSSGSCTRTGLTYGCWRGARPSATAAAWPTGSRDRIPTYR